MGGDSPNVWGYRVSATWWPPTYEANSGSSMRPTESLKCNTNNKENIIWNHYFLPQFLDQKKPFRFCSSPEALHDCFYVASSFATWRFYRASHPTWDGSRTCQQQGVVDDFLQCFSDLLPSTKIFGLRIRNFSLPPQKKHFFRGFPMWDFS